MNRNDGMTCWNFDVRMILASKHAGVFCLLFVLLLVKSVLFWERQSAFKFNVDSAQAW